MLFIRAKHFLNNLIFISMIYLTIRFMQLDKDVNLINNRPGKCLNYRTPSEVFHEQNVALPQD